MFDFNKNNIRWEEHDKLRDCVKSVMTEKRYAHTVGVEEESEKLAGIFEYKETGKIKSAALLHDITKELDKDAQLELCRKYNIELSADDMRAPKSWHAKTGAYAARHEFGADGVIFDAVFCHTFGASREKFGLASKIIYLADWIEPGREHQDCLELRGYFYKNLKNAANLKDKHRVLDDTILQSFGKSIHALLTDGLFIHGDGVKNRNSFI
jgi:predicted HD superfamily hydrolase involved in NAD metabolism